MPPESLGDVLSIIIEAQLENEESLVERLRAIKREFEDFKIHIEMDEGKLNVLRELSENIEALNERIVASEKRKQDAIKATYDTQNEDQRRLQENINSQRKKYEELTETIENAIKTKEKLDKTGEKLLGRQTTTGNKFNQTTETERFNKETGKLETVGYEATKNVQKFQETINELRLNVSDLERKGLNLDKYKQEINGLKFNSEDLDHQITALKRNLKEFGDSAKFYEGANKRLTTMGVNQTSKDTQLTLKSEEEISKRIGEIQADIYKHKQDGVKVTDETRARLEAELTTLNKQIDAYKQMNKEYDKFEKQVGTLKEPKTGIDRNATEFLNEAKIQKEIERIHAEINTRREKGLSLNEENRTDLENQLGLLNRQIQAYQEMQAEIDKVHKGALQENLRRDKLGTKGAEFTGQVFDDSSFNNTQDNLRKQAQAYFETNLGLKGVEQAQIKVTQSTKSLDNEVWKATATIDHGNNVLKTHTLNLDRATNAVYEMGKAEQKSRSIGHASIWEQIEKSMKRVPAYLATFGLAYKAIDQFMQGLQTILDVDKAMTNLIKVADATESQFREFRMEASRMGQDLGVVTSDVIDATTEFSRLGYTLEESTGLGEQSIIFANVGDQTVDSATTNLLSAIRGFNVDSSRAVEESAKYVDIFNEVGNNFAISSAGIGEALKRSSAVLNVAGNSIEQSVALVTAANATIQDPKKVGTAMKTISMRLRGIDEEGEKVVGLVPELKSMFDEIGMDIMLDADTFKSTYQIMDELSNVWDTLTDVRQANIIEAIGGKRQGSIVAAMIGNWQDARDAYSTGLDSAGSASREYEKYQESLEFRIGQLTNSLEQFWLTVWDDDVIKDAISALNSLIQGLTKLVDTFGSVGVAAGGLFTAWTFLNKENRDKFFDPQHNNAFIHSLRGTTNELANVDNNGKKTGTTMEVLSGNFDNAAKSSKRLLGSLLLFAKPLLLFTALGYGIDFIITAFKKAQKQREESIKRLTDEIEEGERHLNDFESFDLTSYYQMETGVNSGAIKEGTVEYERFSLMQDELIEKYPKLISHYNDEGQAVLKSSEAIDEHNKKVEEQILLQRQLREQQWQEERMPEEKWWHSGRVVDDENYDNLAAYEQIDHVGKLIQKTKDEITELSKDSSDVAFSLMDNFISEVDVQNLDKNSSEYKRKYQELIREIEAMMDSGDISDTFVAENRAHFYNMEHGNVEAAKQMIQRDLDAVTEVREELNKTLAKLELDFKGLTAPYQEHLDEIEKIFMSTNKIESNSNNALAFQRLTEVVKDGQLELIELGYTQEEILEAYKTNLGSLDEAFDDVDLELGDLFKGENMEEARQHLMDYAKEAGLTEVQLEMILMLIKNLNRETAKITKEPVSYDISGMQHETDKGISEHLDEMDRLQGVYTDLNEGKTLSLKQIHELTRDYPSLNKAVEKRGNIITFNKDKIRELMDAEEEQHKKFINNMKEQVEQKRKKVKASIQASLDELKMSEEINKLLAKGETDKLRKELEMELKQLTTPSFKEFQDMQLSAMLGIQWKPQEDLFTKAKNLRTKEIRDLLKDLEKYEGIGEELANLEAQLGMDYSGANNRISGEAYEELVYVTSEFRDRLREINTELREQTLIKTRHGRGSEAYRKALQKEIDLLEEQYELTQNLRSTLQEQVNAGYVPPTDTSVPASHVMNNQVSGGGGSHTFQSSSYYKTKDLTQQTPITAAHLNQILDARAKNDAIKGTGEHFIEAANKSGIDALYLFAHAMSETGWGSSKIVKDKNNFFGIGAFDHAPYESAYQYGNVREGILEGAQWISDKYIRGEHNQNTLTKMKYNQGVHEYATDKNWHNVIADIMSGTTKKVLGSTITSPTGGYNTGGTSQALANAAKHYLDAYRVTDEWDSRGGAHRGVDYGRKTLGSPSVEGDPLYNIMEGIVDRIQFQADGGGHLAVIKHDDGSETKYMHMEQAPMVQVGQRVSAGQQIGKIGSTGSSTGPHIHLERWEKVAGKLTDVDPHEWIKNLAGGNVGSGGTNVGFGASTLLKQGSNNDKALVKELQKALNSNGSNLTVDGLYGGKTAQAVRNFQSRKGLDVDGKAGKNTLGALGLLHIGGASLSALYPWMKPVMETTKPKPSTPSVGTDWRDFEGYHTVQKGETMASIAKKYGTTQSHLAELNKRPIMQLAQAGERLVVPSYIRGNMENKTTTTPTTSTGNPTLKKGSKSASVKTLQKLLNQNGANLSVDGVFGAKTDAAVRAFQRSAGIDIDGIVGKDTWSKLKSGGGNVGGGGGGGGGGTAPNVNDGAPTGIPQHEKDASVAAGKDRLAQYDQEMMDNLEKRARLYLEKIESVTIGMDDRAAELDPEKHLLSFLAETVGGTTQEFRDYQSGIGDIVGQQRQTNLDAINFLQDKVENDPNLDNAQIEHINKLLQERLMRDVDYQRTLRDIEMAQVQSGYDEVNEYIEKRWSVTEKSLNDIQRNIKMLDTDENRVAHVALLNEEMKVQKNQRDLAERNIAELENQQHLLKDYPDLYKANAEEIDRWKEQLKDLDEQIFQTDRSIIEVYTKMSDDIIDQYKKMYDDMRDIELKAIDDRMEAQEKAHQAQMDRYEEEMKAFNENIDEQLKALDRTESERDYNRELERMQEERQEIADELALYALDDSLSGRAMAKQLTEDLEDMDEEIYEFQRDRGIELQRQALQDLREARTKEVDEAIEAETDLLDDDREQAEKEKESVNKVYDNLLEDHDLWKQIREQLIEGDVDGIANTLEEYMKLVVDNTDFFGENVAKKMISDIKKQLTDLMGFEDLSKQLDLDIKTILQADSEGYKLSQKDVMDITEGLTGFNRDLFLESDGSADSIKRHLEMIRGDYFPSRPHLQQPEEDQMLHYMPYFDDEKDKEKTITITMNIAELAGGAEGAELLLEELTAELAKKGVTF